jgi:molecular chaperone HtpG
MRTRKRTRKKKVTTIEHQKKLANKNKILCTRPQSEVTDDEHVEFWKTLTNDLEKHLALKRFKRNEVAD